MSLFCLVCYTWPTLVGIFKESIIFVDDFECTDHFIGYAGHCYRLLISVMTYLQAKQGCHNYGGYLVEIENEEESDFVEGTKKAAIKSLNECVAQDIISKPA